MLTTDYNRQLLETISFPWGSDGISDGCFQSFVGFVDRHKHLVSLKACCWSSDCLSGVLYQFLHISVGVIHHISSVIQENRMA